MDASLILYFIGSGFILIGAFLWQKGKRLLSRGKKAQAVIVQNNFHRSREGSGTYHPVVRFLTDTEEVIIQELDFGVNPPMAEGTPLEVLYDPEEPTTVAINSSFPLELLPRLLVAFGVIGVVLASLEILEVISIGD
jgi:hypothetical protein